MKVLAARDAGGVSFLPSCGWEPFFRSREAPMLLSGPSTGRADDLQGQGVVTTRPHVPSHWGKRPVTQPLVDSSPLTLQIQIWGLDFSCVLEERGKGGERSHNQFSPRHWIFSVPWCWDDFSNIREHNIHGVSSPIQNPSVFSGL